MEERAKAQALAQVEGICQMVAALECDYDRLAALKDERDEWDDEWEDGTPWEQENLDDAEELAELLEAAGDCASQEDAEKRIQESPLCVEVRSDWVIVGEGQMSAQEFRIVLCTGGPHVEIQGELDGYFQPCQARILYSDWGSAGELDDFDREAVLTYCRQFYFGE